MLHDDERDVDFPQRHVENGVREIAVIRRENLLSVHRVDKMADLRAQTTDLYSYTGSRVRYAIALAEM